jgi:predicted transcriptional regulator
MGLLDGFEKLINEHGSAVILKERIALANDKYAALEQKLAESELAAKKLGSENQRLNVELEKAIAEIQNLKRLAEKPHGDRLDEVKEKILVLLASQDSFEDNIAQTLGIGSQVAKFHLQDLSEMEFIYRSLSMSGQRFPWQLDQEGRRYLAEHGLLA